MKRIEVTVPHECDGVPIKTFLKKEIGLSSTLIKKVKWGFVFVDGKTVTMRTTVKSGQTVSVNLMSEESDVKPLDIPIEILYEDDYILAINKPTNMPTHPSRGNSLPTLAEGVVAYMKPPFVFRAINRLDRDTSGIVIVAKDAYSADKFSFLMKNGGFTKKYLAVIAKIPREACGIINAPIEREQEGSIKRTVRSDGKNAITEYKVIKTKGERALVELTLHTGRTHQIRVHMAYIGAPLYADFLYGERQEGESYYLHAYYLSFMHPINGKKIEIKSSAPFSL